MAEASGLARRPKTLESGSNPPIPPPQERSQPAWLSETPIARQEETLLPARICSSRKSSGAPEAGVLPDCQARA